MHWETLDEIKKQGKIVHQGTLSNAITMTFNNPFTGLSLLDGFFYVYQIIS